MTVYSIFGRGPTGVSVFVLYLLLWVVLFSFILSHWEKYNTGVLFLPWGYDISQVVSIYSALHFPHVLKFILTLFTAVRHFLISLLCGAGEVAQKLRAQVLLFSELPTSILSNYLAAYNCP